MLNAVLDALIPADPALQMPSATEAGVGFKLSAGSHRATVDAFLALVQATCHARAQASVTETESGFEQGSPAQKLDLLNAARKGNFRLFVTFITVAFQAYYTCPTVLACIGSGAVPPFPQGNTLPTDDWTLLEPVFERGRLYREAE